MYYMYVSFTFHDTRYMLPPDGLWTLDAAIARYNSADRAAQSKFWENELKATELLLEDILKQTYDFVRKKHDERAFALNEAVPEPAIELDAILNVKFNTTSEIIAQKALDINASMIVVIKHDKSWFTKIIEGSSVADSVMRKANCPVLVYHATPSQTKEEETKMKEKEAKRPGGKHASQTKL
jgi:nucleotide-binding universal stress UspA family protein